MMENRDNTIYENNIEVLKQANPYLWDDVKERIEYREQVYFDQSVKGEDIIAVIKNEGEWYLNSRYDADMAAEKWAESFGKLTYAAILVIFGFGNGMYIKELGKQYPENLIIVYEPSREVFEAALNEIDLTEVLDDESIFIAVGEAGYKLFTEYICEFINYTNFTYVKWKVIPNYQRLFELEYLKVQNIYMNWVRQLTLDRNTLLIFQNDFAGNVLSNIWECLSGYSMNVLARKVREKVDREKYPAVIVAAGPSLDKNIKELKRLKNRAYIIVVDTALKAVLRAGVRPDIAVTVDPNKELVLFEDERIAQLPMLVCIMSNTKVLDRHKGKKIYFGESDSYCDSICKKYEKELSPLESGGSVANNAFSLAKFLGFKTIILMGQDLAYPDKKGHTKDAYDDEKKNEIDFSKKKYIEVEDVYGGKVWTEGNMDAYRKWFETQIMRYPELRVIDATEGGAKIHGAEILTLEEVIRRECEDLSEVDFEKITEELQPYFTKDELEEVRAQLLNIPEELDKIKEKLKEGIEKNQELKKAAKDRKMKVAKLKGIVEEVQEISVWLEEKPEMRLVEMYNYEADYKMKGKVLNIQKDITDEFTMIADNGIEMYESYFEAIDKLEKNLDKLYTRMS